MINEFTLDSISNKFLKMWKMLIQCFQGNGTNEQEVFYETYNNRIHNNYCEN